MSSQTEELVVVDTCVWAAFFKRSGGETKDAVTALLKRDRVALVGPIITEVLLGFRNTRQADWVASVLDGAVLLTLDASDWRNAATLGRRLARRGHKLPVTDLVIGSACQRLSCWAFSTDPHFDAMDDIKRYSVDDV